MSLSDGFFQGDMALPKFIVSLNHPAIVPPARERQAHLGDLLEPGEWTSDDAAPYRFPGSSSPPSPQFLILAAYRRAAINPLGQCMYFVTRGHGSGRIGLCQLEKGHRSWTGAGVTGKSAPEAATRHRVYLFSARDSAAMLESMRRRLTEPMEEL